jgi:hypothetical protein
VADYHLTAGGAIPDGPAPTKRELLAALAASRDEVLRLVRSMDPARLEDGRYENGRSWPTSHPSSGAIPG